MHDFEYARDKVLMGAAREDVMAEEEKLITAYHEAGHTLLAWLTPGCDRVHKVTILPRGRALGVTQLVPEEERYNISQTGSAVATGDAAGRPGGRETASSISSAPGPRAICKRRRGWRGGWSRTGA